LDPAPAPAPSFHLREAAPPEEKRRLAAELSLPPAVADLAWQRGIRGMADWEEWTSVDVTEQHDPHLLPDMDLAVDRLLFAREHGQKVLVHGDYDVDGLTGAALLYRALRGLGLDAQAFVPHRERDGYGLSRRALEHSRERGCSLVVTVDCGSSDGELIEEMALGGLDTIVTDHHLATERPEALAFVSPMRSGSEYPFEHLAGSAIAYKLALALHEALGRPQAPETWLDYVALGTVADVMPLKGENRLLVRAGLREMSRRLTARRGSREDVHPAWRALARVAKLPAGELSAQDLAFRLAPRLNAPGRLGSARPSLDLLCATDADEVDSLARRIEEINERRRKLEGVITEDAREAARRRLERAERENRHLGILVLAGEGWQPGVLGISAARLVEEFGLPVLLMGLEADGSGRGSGRGQEGQDMKKLLDGACAHLERHGGHRRAVGFNLKAGHWESFSRELEDCLPAPGGDGSCRLLMDVAVKGSELNRDFLDGLEQLGPFGEGNPEPLLLLRRAVPTDARVLKGCHLRIEFLADDGLRRRAIVFGRAEQLQGRVEPGVETDLCLRVARDTYQRRPGEHGVALHLVDLGPAEAAS